MSLQHSNQIKRVIAYSAATSLFLFPLPFLGAAWSGSWIRIWRAKSPARVKDLQHTMSVPKTQVSSSANRPLASRTLVGLVTSRLACRHRDVQHGRSSSSFHSVILVESVIEPILLGQLKLSNKEILTVLVQNKVFQQWAPALKDNSTLVMLPQTSKSSLVSSMLV